MAHGYLKNGETLALDAWRCVGCGACVEVCPHAVFKIMGGKAEIASRASCMECGACAKNCPAGALAVTAGVGCAAAIIRGKLFGTEPTCDCGSGSTGKGKKKRACC
ncbi:MAG TPA: mercury methylation ferredoxin HgcB [Treponemataceae bacterium]|nr:mercury methylation ferredoxin HgcB [Treponemataceae bacterium]HPS44134.1 mercury methylation ferredoxin HgcB [Treponemataceae bacterium]